MNAATSPDPTLATVTPRSDDEFTHKTAITQGWSSMSSIPARYRGAVATAPGVCDYARELIRTADEREPRAYGVPPAIVAGPSLLLLGPTGTGKTHQAYGAIRALAVSGAACKWRAVTTADLYAEMRPRHQVDSEQVFEEYARAWVLLLDDLGAAKATEWTEEVTYRIVTRRYNEQRPTIITSNLAPKQLAPALGVRVASRLLEMSTVVALTGQNYRDQK
jgi:DNA replication protein DnaC